MLRSHTSTAGFTIIELLIAVAVLGVLAAIAAPSFTDLSNSMRLSSTQSRLFGDLQLARGESVKRNARVLVCVRDSAGTGCGTGTSWANGWLVCADFNADGACDASTADNPNPVRSEAAIPATLTLTAPAAVARFNPDGSQGAGASVSFSITGTWPGAATKTVTIAGSGNITKN